MPKTTYCSNPALSEIPKIRGAPDRPTRSGEHPVSSSSDFVGFQLPTFSTRLSADAICEFLNRMNRL